VLMLLFLGGMVAFCLVGDLFTLFVTFELMTITAVALTAYHTEDRGPLQGAFAFGVTNLVGSFLSLSGVALLYGRAEALNLAQVRVAMMGTPLTGSPSQRSRSSPWRSLSRPRSFRSTSGWRTRMRWRRRPCACSCRGSWCRLACTVSGACIG